MRCCNLYKKELVVCKDISKLSEFEYLVVPFSIDSYVTAVQEVLLNKTLEVITGKIIVDSFATSGNNEYRFITYDVYNNVLELSSLEYKVFERDSKVRQEANQILRDNKEYTEYSILNKKQKELLFKGIDI